MNTNDLTQKIQTARKQGYSDQQISTFLSAKGTDAKTIANALKPIAKPKEQGGFVETIKDIPSDIAERFGGAVESVTKGIEKADTTRTQVEQGEISPLAGTIKTIGGGLQAGADVIGQGLLGLGKLFTSPFREQAISEGVTEGAQAIAESEPVKALVQKYESLSPEQKATIDGFLGTAEGLTTMFGAGPATKVLRTGIEKTVEAASTATKAGISSADDVFNAAKNLKNQTQTLIANKTVDPKLKTAAERLFLEGTDRVSDPLATYDKFLAQSKVALKDIKTDPAVSVVGESIGDAFNTVVRQRRSIGETIGEELKAVGKLKVNVTEPKTKLLSELKESGLSYNPKTNSLTSFQGSKFASEEISMLNQFVKDVQSLGETPSVAQIDRFISKTRSDLAFASGKSGVIGTTNAERIIKTALSSLRESLNPAKNGLPQLDKYWTANKAYADLSDFVEEGSGFLGKVTQSGDFAKDASLAKSAVQSILNNGKKDWLIRLEALSGYPALDEAVLALQAMKDAGDFRGTSLLQAISEGAVPTSKSGFTQKVIDFAIEKGTQVVAGTPEEQTRAFLIDLAKKRGMNK